MWWPVVFWILLVPLIIAEAIIFVKTKKLSWLIYALSIFTYVITVSYTLDVFDAGRNAVILTLLLSAVLMALIGRHLGRSVKKQKKVNSGILKTVFLLIGIIVVLFVVSVIAGKASEQITPVASIKASELITAYDAGKELRPVPQDTIAVLERTVSNSFFMPVPIVRQNYRVCVPTSGETLELYMSENYQDSYPEVAPFSTLSQTVYLQSFSTDKPSLYDPIEVRIYVVEQRGYSWVPCDQLTMEPDFVIPIV